jgi:putative ABC transport system permease protein
MENHKTAIRRQIHLKFWKSVRMAWQSIRVRMFRSILVVSGIVLALSFLTYILASDALLRGVAANGSAELKADLERQGVLANLADEDAAIQTRWMAGLALMISFVGILNAMLLSVTERFHEIGTMKCLGALDSLIVRLFLLESVFIGSVGTTAGILIGLALAVGEAWMAYGAAAWTAIPLLSMLQIVGICYLIGVVLTVGGALYPAWRAARMQPVVALRSGI